MPSISRPLDELRNWFGLISLLVGSRHASAARLYKLISTKNVLSDKTLFLNLGYWQNARDYDEACFALARIVAEVGDMNSDDLVLDAGFGFAEQDLFWTRTFRPVRIVGLNISKLQVEIAAQRVRQAGCTDRVQLINGSATEMPIADRSVTKVVALESAFHFDTRERFFREAYRVLKPGGRIVLADLLYLPRVGAPSFKKRVLNNLWRSAWQIPGSNVDTVEGYAEKLRSARFIDVQVRSIRDCVLLPFRCYVRTWLNTPNFADQMSRPMQILWRTASSGMAPGGPLDYVIASASRP